MAKLENIRPHGVALLRVLGLTELVVVADEVGVLSLGTIISAHKLRFDADLQVARLNVLYSQLSPAAFAVHTL